VLVETAVVVVVVGAVVVDDAKVVGGAAVVDVGRVGLVVVAVPEHASNKKQRKPADLTGRRLSHIGSDNHFPGWGFFRHWLVGVPFLGYPEPDDLARARSNKERKAMHKTRINKKRLIVALLLATLAFAGMVASAASLGGITNGNLGADDTVVASCDTNGVTLAYTYAYNTTGTAGYKVVTVTVGGINDACDGQAIGVTLTGAANASLESVSSTVPVGAGTTAVLNFASTTLAESVIGAHIVIAAP
jgi:hypothetical protein